MRKATEVWAAIEFVLIEECGLQLDGGIRQERSNFIAMIGNAIDAAKADKTRPAVTESAGHK